MLEDIKALDKSIDGEKILKLRSILGDDLYLLFDLIFDAETEDDARTRIADFVTAIKKSPLKIVKARRALDKTQTKIIMKFLDL